MKLINNRYRIIHDLEDLDTASSHLVKDLTDARHKTALIVAKEKLDSRQLKYYTENFGIFRNLTSKYIIESYDFGVLRKINNKNNRHFQYYFVTEYVSGAASIESVLDELTSVEALDLFVQACRAIYFMHLKNLVYGGLNFDTITVTREDGKYNLKLQDIPTMDFYSGRKLGYQGVRNDAFFKSPEVIFTGETSVKADIYSLGVLLFYLLVRPTDVANDFKAELSEYKSGQHERSAYEDALIPVVEKMTAELGERYNSVAEALRDINERLGTEYNAVAHEEVERLSFGTKLIGRDAEASRVRECLSAVMSGNADKRLMRVYGESGVGKTFFLNTVYTALYLENLKVYTCTANDGDIMIRNLLKQLLDEYDASDIEDSSFISSIKLTAYNLEDDSGFVQQADSNAALKFIYDMLKDTPAMLIIDDIDRAAADVFGLIEQLMAICKKLMVIVSHRKVFENRYFTEFLKNNKRTISEISLPPLTRNDTEKFILHSLGMLRAQQAFADAVYSSTGGNPLFIEEVLKYLHLSHLLFVDRSDGMWQLKYEQGKIPMPLSIDQAMREHTDKITEYDLNILKALSVYKSAVYARYLSPLTRIPERELKNRLNSYVRDGFLYSRSRGTEVSYGFSNEMLKDYIYNKISLSNRPFLHGKALEILMNCRKEEHQREHDDEIVYHLEKTHSDEKLLEYAVANAKKYDGMVNYDKALLYADKALSASRRIGCREKECEVLRLCALYERRRGNISEAIQKFEEAQKIAAENKIDGELMYIISSLAYTRHINGEYKLAAEYLKKCEDFFADDAKKSEYTESFTCFRDVSITMLCDEKRYSEAYTLVIDTIRWYSKSDYSGLAYIYQRLGIICNGLGLYGEALEYNDVSISYSVKAGRISGQITALNNSGAVYMNSLNNFLMAKSVFNDALKIAANSRSIKNMSKIYRNLAEINLHELNYQSAMLCCAEARQYAELSNDKRQIPAIDFCLGLLYTLTDHYGEAHSLLTENINLANSGELLPSDLPLLRKFAAHFYYRVGHLGLSQMYIDAFMNHNQAHLTLIDRELVLLNLRIEASTAKHEQIPALYEKMKSVNVGMGSRIKELDELCEFLRAASKTGTVYLKDIIEQELSHNTDDIPFELRSKILYLQSLTQTANVCEKTLLASYETAKKSGQTMVRMDICMRLGEFYSNTSAHSSMIYYVEACELAQGMLSEMPMQLRRGFAEHHNLILPFDKISELESASNPAGNTQKDFRYNTKDIVEDIMAEKNFFEELRKNVRFNEAAKRSFLAKLPDGVASVGDLIGCLGTVPEINLILISNYLMFLTYASRCMFVTVGKQSDTVVVAASDNDTESPFDDYPVKRAVALESEILLTVEAAAQEDTNMFADGKKAVMCIPVVFGGDRASGCVYLYSNSRFHNFTEESLERCKELLTLIRLNMNFYALKTESSLDKLTGAYNRAYLEAALDFQIEKAKKNGTKFSVILIDIDKFKAINDTYGHQTGDDVLRDLGRVIRSSIRGDTVFGRYGGEEFLVILDGVGGSGAMSVAQRLRRTIENAKILGSKRPVTASMGVSVYNVHDTSKVGLIEKADKALYMSKEKGRNRCEIYDSAYEHDAKSMTVYNPVISGDAVKDSMRMWAVLEIIRLIELDIPYESKLRIFLDKVCVMCGADYAEISFTGKVKVSCSDVHGELSVFQQQRDFVAFENEYLIFRRIVRGSTVLGHLLVSAELSQTEFTQSEIGFIEYMCKLAAVLK